MHKYVSMNPEIKAKWVTALTDGSYTQGEGYLRIDAPDEATGENLTTFCCLGVLCDLAIKDGLDIKVERDRVDNGETFHTLYDENDAFLPKSVRDWAGMTGADSSGTFCMWMDNDSRVRFIDKSGNENEDNTLIGLNDAGVDFAGIAKVIEDKF